MLSSAKLKEIVTEARPIIERQLDDAERIAGLRDVVSSAGGDWSALKALIKAQIQDERDEAGEGKRVRKILDKAEYSTGYAEMLGWANMNEQNFSAEEFDAETGEITEPQSVPSAAQGSDEAPFVASQPHPEAKASTDSGATEQAKEGLADSVTGDASRPSVGGGTDAPIQPETEAPYVPQPVPSIILPEVPADFNTDIDKDDEALKARMRRTLKARPGCKRPWSCGRYGDQSECGQCLKAAQEEGQAA